jgi:hypothetical protein
LRDAYPEEDFWSRSESDGGVVGFFEGAFAVWSCLQGLDFPLVDGVCTDVTKSLVDL